MIRTEISEVEAVLATARRDIQKIQERIQERNQTAPGRWLFARAFISNAESYVHAAQAKLRESHDHIPTDLDMDA